MELECKREDGSWHPCQISLSEGNAAIIVAFENCGEEEEEEEEEDDQVESIEEGSTRLRFRSQFLKGGECSQLVEGQCVLARDDASSSNLFFDAILEKINRVRHSERLACRCTISLKWIPNNLKNQKVRVPSTSIMRISDKNIETHPVFEAFMASKNYSRADMQTPPDAFISPLSENFLGVDLDGLLEKQVQEISVMAQGADFSKDVILGIQKANQKGLEIKKTRNPNSGGRRFTRSNQSKQEEIKPPIKEAKEKPGRSLSFLSPLAARAAFASLLSSLPASALPASTLPASTLPASGLNASALPASGLTASGLTASGLPASGVPKQLKQTENNPPLTPNRSNYCNSEKACSPDTVITRRVTRSAAKRGGGGVDLMADMQGTRDQKADVENLVTPIKTENKKRICISSPSESTGTSASNFTDTVSDSEGEAHQDVESCQIVVKKKKMVFRKPPTRFSSRLAQLDRDISQTNK